MEIRPRTRLKLRRAALIAGLGALLVPATAGAAVKPPVITKVAPKSVSVGGTLTIYGKNFRRGRGKNKVLFKRDGGKALFVKAGLSTTRRMSVVIPGALQKYMGVANGRPAASRFRLRVLTSRLSRAFTSAAASPVVGPAPAKPGHGGGPVTGGPGGPAVQADTDGDGLVDAVDDDDDNDLLTDAQESALGLSTVDSDSDGDGVEDGYEYQSALDLNNGDNVMPYPAERRYPNPLFKDDEVDYDGDGLSLAAEQDLWKYSYTTAHTGTRTRSPLTYSDGKQYSVAGLTRANYQPPQQFQTWAAGHGFGTVGLHSLVAGQHNTRDPYSLYDFDRSNGVTLAPTGGQVWSERYYWDYDFNDRVSDDERDEDADGLTNFDEFAGAMTAALWKGCYQRETSFPILYSGTSPVEEDSDGDGILDGADDQDFDDVPNIMEISRSMASGRPWANTLPCDSKNAVADPTPAEGFVQPFNPCLPDRKSRTCLLHPIIDRPFPPFDPSYTNYLVLN